jgi:hypothetical protein
MTIWMLETRWIIYEYLNFLPDKYWVGYGYINSLPDRYWVWYGYQEI